MPAEPTPVLRFAKLSSEAFAPTKGSEKAAGFDLKRWDQNFNKFPLKILICYFSIFSAYDCIVPARGKFIVKTDIQIHLPEGCYGRVAPRSGLAAKNFIDVGGKLINFIELSIIY